MNHALAVPRCPESNRLSRRLFLQGSAFAVVGTCGILIEPASRGADEPGGERPTGEKGQKMEISKTTHTFKQVGELKIAADVYRPGDNSRRPVAVWIHGGALIVGNREGIDPRVKEIVLELGCVLVSIDYRLAPETKLPEIIGDVEDAFRWIRQEGPELFSADADRLVVLGGSAGGYLTLVTGHRVEPRPQGLVALYGYGGLLGDWYTRPSPHPRHQEPKLTRDEAYQQVAGPAVSDSRDRKGNGGAFYQYCRQQGHWPKAVSGWDPATEAERFVPFLPARNVSPQYPATLLIHGTADTDVPYDESVQMARELKRHDVQHELVTIPDGEHGFGGGDAAVIDRAYDRIRTFVAERLQVPIP